MLDAKYQPLGGGEPQPPAYPRRVRSLIYAFAQAAYEDDAKMAGAKVQSRSG